jgi:hypothetical protein
MTWNREKSNKPLEQMEPDHFLDQLHKIRLLLYDARRNDTQYSDSTGQEQDNTRRVGDRRLNKANTHTLLGVHTNPARAREHPRVRTFTLLHITFALTPED